LSPLPPRSAAFPYTTLFRSFGKLFEVPTTEGAPRKVHVGGENDMDIALHRLIADYFPDPPHQFGIPGCPERRNARSKQRVIFKRSEEHTSELQSRENLVCRL